MPSPWRLRVALVLSGALGLLVLLPRVTAPVDPAMPPLHGERHGSTVRYAATPLGDVLDDVARVTGFRAVTLPPLANSPFTGDIELRASNGQGAVATLAVEQGLVLRHAGPHWVLVQPAN